MFVLKVRGRGFVVGWDCGRFCGGVVCERFEGVIGVGSRNVGDGKRMVVMWYELGCGWRLDVGSVEVDGIVVVWKVWIVWSLIGRMWIEVLNGRMGERLSVL